MSDTSEARERKPGATYKGSVSAADPRYKSGWNFVMGNNVSLKAVKPDDTPKDGSL